MSVLSRFQTIEKDDKEKAVRFLVERATPDFDFFFLMTLAVLMASFGLLSGSETIVIGSMLIAPLLYPVLGLSLGISMSDTSLLRRSLWTIIKASFLGIAAAIAATFFSSTSGGNGITPEIAFRATPSLLLLVVAVVSGLAVSYSLVKPKLSETLPGIAVSVALLPPLAVVGIGVAWLDFTIVVGALSVYVVNVFGILASAIISFSLMNVYGERKVAKTTLVREERRVEKEETKIQKADEEAEKPADS